jgi:FMN phosphatase YigB (HAD superfamily)
MKKTLLIFDFDRTLFNLTRFLRDLQHYVWELPDTPDDELAVTNKTIELFLEPKSYADPEHLRLWLAPKLLPDSDYVYEDAAKLLAHLPASITPIILTHGVSEEKQYFKRWFAPRLQALPFYVTDDNKGYLLAGGVQTSGKGVAVDLPHLKGQFDEVVLVDDNPITFKPLVAANSPIRMIHMAREGEPHTKTKVPAGVTAITSLDDLLAAIK